MTFQRRFTVASETIFRRTFSVCFPVIVFALLVAIQGKCEPANARFLVQTQHSAAKPQGKKKYRLKITTEGVVGISLKADKAKLSEIAVELSKRLGTKIILGPGMEKEAITVEFYDLTLEPAVRLLAPRVLIDYEIKANAQPTPLGIFLLNYNDPEPATSAVVQASSQAMMISGNTEDTGENTEVNPDDPLQIELEDNYLTVKSKKRPLIEVVLEIAELLGVPAGINYESDEIVDLEIKDTPLEDAIPRLSPNIRLYVRADLTKSHRVPLRLAIVPPPAKSEGQ
jgi:hypothetical protein